MNTSSRKDANLVTHRLLNGILQVSFWILLSNVPCLELLRCHCSLLLYRFVVRLSQVQHRLEYVSDQTFVVQSEAYLDSSFIGHLVSVEISKFEGLRPVLFMQVHKHRLLDFRLPVVDGDRVVMAVQTVDERLDRRLLNMADI